MKMNRIKLHKQVETMNKEQLIVLCKSLIDINCELEDRKDKAIEYLKDNACYENTISELFCDDLDTDSCMELLDILRGKDNE